MIWYNKSSTIQPMDNGPVQPQLGNSNNKEAIKEAKSKKKNYSIAATTRLDIAVDNARDELKDKFYFQALIVVSGGLAIAEPIAVGYDPVGIDYKIQLAILALSSILFVVAILVIAFAIPDRHEKEVSEGGEVVTTSAITTTTPPPITTTKTEYISFIKRVSAAMDGEVYFELICLTIGWVCIFENTGVAAIRCFRVFRYLWYLELYEEDKGPDYKPEEHPISLIHSCQLCLEYLEKITVEVLSEKSKGGLVILGLFFYVSYIVAVVSWNIRRDLATPEGDSCLSLLSCFVIMLRLSFYDGTGFDFLQYVIDDHLPGLAFILIVYMCFSAMILLNGLIGVFGLAFTTSDDDDDDEGDDEEEGEEGDENEETMNDDDSDDIDIIKKKLQISELNLQMANETIKKLREENALNSSLVDRIMRQLTKLER